MFRKDYVVIVKLDSRLHHVVVEGVANALDAEALARKEIVRTLGKNEQCVNEAMLVMIPLDEGECKRLGISTFLLSVRSEPILKPIVYRDAEDNLTVGFLSRVTDTLIDDPEISTCGRFRVDPEEAYGLDKAELRWMLELKTRLKQALMEGRLYLAKILNTDQVQAGELNKQRLEDAIAVAFAELHGIEHQIGD